jgi:hypothetical protein
MIGNGSAIVVAALDFFRRQRPPRSQPSGGPTEIASVPEAVDSTVQTIARDNGAHARGRSGEHEVPGQQLVVLRQECERVRNVPDHVREIAFLTTLAVDVEPDLPRASWPDGAHGMNRRDRRRLRERLADVPRPLLLAHVALQIAARHVQSDRVAIDQSLRGFRARSSRRSPPIATTSSIS